MRVLFLLDHCRGTVADGEPPGAVAVVRGQKRLQALDFWLRSPDYLADELLNLHEGGGLAGVDLVERAAGLLEGDEPDLASYPMVRWRFGAFEALDDALALLFSHGMVAIEAVGQPPQVDRWDYYLMPPGRRTAQELRDEEPDLRWYDERAALVLLVAGDRSGSSLKEIQYRQAEYERTHMGESIDRITDRVRARLANITNDVRGAAS